MYESAQNFAFVQGTYKKILGPLARLWRSWLQMHFSEGGVPVVKGLRKKCFIKKLRALILPQFPRSHMYSILSPELFRL